MGSLWEDKKYIQNAARLLDREYVNEGERSFQIDTLHICRAAKLWWDKL